MTAMPHKNRKRSYFELHIYEHYVYMIVQTRKTDKEQGTQIALVEQYAVCITQNILYMEE